MRLGGAGTEHRWHWSPTVADTEDLVNAVGAAGI